MRFILLDMFSSIILARIYTAKQHKTFTRLMFLTFKEDRYIFISFVYIKVIAHLIIIFPIIDLEMYI